MPFEISVRGACLLEPPVNGPKHGHLTADDEREYLETVRSTGRRAATSLFNTQLKNKTAQNIAKLQREFQAELAGQQLAFATEQRNLDRALEREKLSILSRSGPRASGFDLANSFIGGAAPFITAAIKK